jgi:hypothetical protein
LFPLEHVDKVAIVWGDVAPCHINLFSGTRT